MIVRAQSISQNSPALLLFPCKDTELQNTPSAAFPDLFLLLTSETLITVLFTSFKPSQKGKEHNNKNSLESVVQLF